MSEVKEDENNGVLDEVQPEDINPDLFEEELNKKIENFLLRIIMNYYLLIN